MIPCKNVECAMDELKSGNDLYFLFADGHGVVEYNEGKVEITVGKHFGESLAMTADDLDEFLKWHNNIKASTGLDMEYIAVKK